MVAKIESLQFTVTEKIEEASNAEFICQDARDQVQQAMEAVGAIVDGDVTETAAIRECFNTLDRFQEELAHKKRFNS